MADLMLLEGVFSGLRYYKHSVAEQTGDITLYVL